MIFEFIMFNGPSLQSSKQTDSSIATLTITKMADQEIIEKISFNAQDGLNIKKFSERRTGIVATRNFRKNEYVITYSGELVDSKVAEEREIRYANNPGIDSFMYWFSHKGEKFCIDATNRPMESYGRLVNHNLNNNLESEVLEVKGKPNVVFFAKRNIKKGEEITYDYSHCTKKNVSYSSCLGAIDEHSLSSKCQTKSLYKDDTKNYSSEGYEADYSSNTNETESELKENDGKLPDFGIVKRDYLNLSFPENKFEKFELTKTTPDNKMKNLNTIFQREGFLTLSNIEQHESSDFIDENFLDSSLIRSNKFRPNPAEKTSTLFSSTLIQFSDTYNDSQKTGKKNYEKENSKSSEEPLKQDKFNKDRHIETIPVSDAKLKATVFAVSKMNGIDEPDIQDCESPDIVIHQIEEISTPAKPQKSSLRSSIQSKESMIATKQMQTNKPTYSNKRKHPLGANKSVNISRSKIRKQT